MGLFEPKRGRADDDALGVAPSPHVIPLALVKRNPQSWPERYHGPRATAAAAYRALDRRNRPDPGALAQEDGAEIFRGPHQDASRGGIRLELVLPEDYLDPFADGPVIEPAPACRGLSLYSARAPLQMYVCL